MPPPAQISPELPGGPGPSQTEKKAWAKGSQRWTQALAKPAGKAHPPHLHSPGGCQCQSPGWVWWAPTWSGGPWVS